MVPDGCRYAHLTWDQVVPLAHEVWGGGEDAQRAAVVRVDDVTQSLGQSWGAWRESRLGPLPSQPAPTQADPVGVVQEALGLARLTAEDHEQRAVDFAAESLEELKQLARDVAAALAAESDPALLHVAPWLWNLATSTGRPLTPSVAEVGYELRLSGYANPQR